VQFRKSKKVGPFRFTLSNRGLSTSAGAGPLRFSRGADGKVRRTIRVPGVGLYDTKVIGQPPQQRALKKISDMPTHAGGMPPPGWYPDPAGTSGRAYWNGREWGSPPPKPPTDRRTWIIVGSIVGVVLMLIMLGNCGGNDQKPVASTVTKTVTVTAQPPTVTVTAAPPTSIVTVTQAAPPPPAFFEPPASDAAPPPESFEPPAPPPIPVAPPPSSSVYYDDCSEARAAGAAPILVGEPGYRSGLDRDGDGVACE
jgi:hypothetical protein